jgi:hypothetical protein
MNHGVPFLAQTCLSLQEKAAAPECSGFLNLMNEPYLLRFLHCSHCWLATLQEVLLADWQEVWHSPQPPVFADLTRSLVAKVLILFTMGTTFPNG